MRYLTRLLSRAIAADRASSVLFWCIVIIIIIYFLIKKDKEPNEYLDNILPWQMVLIVRQVHENKPFSTYHSLVISDELKAKLVYPLTAEMWNTINNTLYPVTERNIVYEIGEYKNNRLEFEGTVYVTIDYCDTSKDIDIHYNKVPIYIKFVRRFRKFKCIMEVLEVEYK